jgi:hypothetical protein
MPARIPTGTSSAGTPPARDSTLRGRRECSRLWREWIRNSSSRAAARSRPRSMLLIQGSLHKWIGRGTRPRQPRCHAPEAFGEHGPSSARRASHRRRKNGVERPQAYHDQTCAAERGTIMRRGYGKRRRASPADCWRGTRYLETTLVVSVRISTSVALVSACVPGSAPLACRM